MKPCSLALILTLCATSACAQHASPVDDGDAASVRAAAVTREYALTTDKIECLYFDTKDEGTDILVRVREHHTKACGGDPDFAPTLFFLKIRKRDGYTTTTAYSTDGTFQALKAPARPANEAGQ